MFADGVPDRGVLGLGSPGEGDVALSGILFWKSVREGVTVKVWLFSDDAGVDVEGGACGVGDGGPGIDVDTIFRDGG